MTTGRRGGTSRWFAAAGVGLAVTCTVHARYDSDRLVDSALGLGAPLALFGVLTVIAYWMLYRIAGPRTADCSRKCKMLWGLGALVAGVLVHLVVPIPIPPCPWAPVQQLEIVATGEMHPAAKSAEVYVQALLMPSGSRVPTDEFVFGSEWEIRDNALLSYKNQPATLRWQGRVRGDAKLRLTSHPWSGVARITWNGVSQRVDLYAESATVKVLTLSPRHSPAWSGSLFRALVFGADVIGIGASLFVAGVWLAARPTRAVRAARSRWSWAGFALPCMLVWMVALIAFWPGMMSPDSIDQWWQMKSGHISDDHPAIHTLINWLITRVWFSPAAIAIVQSVVLGSVVGWGLARMRELGMPRWLAWITCAAVALSPINGRLAITLWKDIPFTVAMLALTILLLEVVVSDGAWLRRPAHWLLLGFLAALVALFRHNGPPAACGTLALLALFFRRCWWCPLLAMGVAVVCVLGVRGPLYRAVGIQKVVDLSRYRNAALGSVRGSPVYCLAAHIACGTPLTDSERGLLESVCPLEVWRELYDPFRQDRLRLDQRVRREALREHRAELVALRAALDARNPWPSRRHTYWRTAFVWRIRHPHNSYYSRALGNYYRGEILTIAHNNQGLAPQPISPWLRQKYADLITWFDKEDWFWLTWRPALYLWISIAGVLVAAARARRCTYLIIIVPILINSFFVAWLAPSQDFRYQYPVYLTGLLMAGFLLWSAPRLPLAERESEGEAQAT